MKYLLILTLFFLINSFTKDTNTILTEYYHNGKIKRIKSGSKILFIQSGDSVLVNVYQGKVILPALDTINDVNVIFCFNEKKLSFNSIHPLKLINRQNIKWELNFYNKFDKKSKQIFYRIKDFSKIKTIYYWKFEPIEFGDGTAITVTILKDSLM